MSGAEKDGRVGGLARRNRAVMVGCVVFVASMLGVAYAAVPLYTLFCQITGYAGTTRRAEMPSDRVLDQMVTVRFDANVGAKLPWRFRPVEPSVRVRLGEVTTVNYVVENRADHPVTASATFNVTPEISGSFFSKLTCFCFTEQTLQAGEVREMPVTFYVDPALVDDPDARYVSTITLSYTFFEVKDAAPLAARQTGEAEANRQL
jgi:Cytochrome oxidase assembly factor